MNDMELTSESKMKEYRYKIIYTIFKIILTIILVVCNMAYIISYGYQYIIRFSIILSAITVLYSIYLNIKYDKIYKVKIYDEKLNIQYLDKWIVEETKMPTEDITIISCYRKYIIFKKLYISSRYKSVTLNIRNFKNYKEMLKTIIEKTENNKNIRIDQAVYEMIK